jgi:hypothetical protein
MGYRKRFTTSGEYFGSIAPTGLPATKAVGGIVLMGGFRNRSFPGSENADILIASMVTANMMWKRLGEISRRFPR